MSDNPKGLPEAKVYFDFHPRYLIGPRNVFKRGDLVELPESKGKLMVRVRSVQDDGVANAIIEGDDSLGEFQGSMR